MGTVVATKSDIGSFELLGGQTFQGVGFTRDQVENLWKCYGFLEDNKRLAKKGQDTYEEAITVNVKHKETVAKLLRERSLEFSLEDGAKSVVFRVLVPQGFQELEVLPELWSGPYIIRSWEKLHEATIQATNFVRTGSIRNLFRHANSDGLRIMAFLSKFCEPGEDPVQLIARVLADQGYDIEEFNEESES